MQGTKTLLIWAQGVLKIITRDFFGNQRSFLQAGLFLPPLLYGHVSQRFIYKVGSSYWATLIISRHRKWNISSWERTHKVCIFWLRETSLYKKVHSWYLYRVDQKKRTPLSYIPLISLFSADFLKFSASNRQHDTSIKLWCPESVVFTIL